jgi:transcriptional regulator with XRE-family HTH domain
MTLGEKIKQVRKQKRMSQYDLARASGVKRANINLYENNGVKHRPDKENLLHIAEALGMDPNELYALANYSHDKISEPSPERLAGEIDRILSTLIPVYASPSANEVIDYIAVSTKGQTPKSWKAYRLPDVSFPSKITTNDTIIVDTEATEYHNGDLVICSIKGKPGIREARQCEPDDIIVKGVVVGAIKRI